VRGAEVHEDAAGHGGERTGLALDVDHRRSGADREQHIGGEVGDDRVGEALHERLGFPQPEQRVGGEDGEIRRTRHTRHPFASVN
jgi:hypothetical protein